MLPEPDPNMQKCIKTFKLTPKDMAGFWKKFQQLDKSKTGLISLATYFKTIECERNMITDCLLELLEIEHDGEINFSDFLTMICSFCFFETHEILRFCFYCFDQDRTGFFSTDDLNSLINAVHNIKTGETVKGNVKGSWMQLTLTGDKLDFEEFAKISNAFPNLFMPAFRLQQRMMMNMYGEGWWEHKKYANKALKEKADAKILKKKKDKEAKEAKKKARKIQRSMGLAKYWCCPCLRKYYDGARTEYDDLSDAERLKRDKEMAAAKRAALLKMKAPETATWEKYDKKTKKDEEYVPTKLLAVERPREIRAETREERRLRRHADPELRLKARTTVSGADI